MADFLRAFATAEHCGAYILYSAKFSGVESSFTDDPVMIWLGHGYVHELELNTKLMRISVGSRGALVRLVVPLGAVVGYGIHDESGDSLLVRRSVIAPPAAEEPAAPPAPKPRRGLRAV